MAEEIKATVTETAEKGGDHASPNGAAANQRLAQGDAGNTADTVSTSEQTEKTFTQKELDEIVKQRLDRAAKGQPSKEELKKFREWQLVSKADPNKTEEQKTAERISAAENARAESEKLLAAANAKVAALSKGVRSDAVDDVIALAMVRVSDNVTIDKAIDGILEKYPDFGSAKPKGISTGTAFGNAEAGVSGVEAYFRAKNPDIKI